MKFELNHAAIPHPASTDVFTAEWSEQNFCIFRLEFPQEIAHDPVDKNTYAL